MGIGRVGKVIQQIHAGICQSRWIVKRNRQEGGATGWNRGRGKIVFVMVSPVTVKFAEYCWSFVAPSEVVTCPGLDRIRVRDPAGSAL